MVLYIWGVQGDLPPKIRWPLVAQKVLKSNPANFRDNRICSLGARAASILSTQSCSSSFEKQYQVFNDLDGLKGPLLVYTNHINKERHVHHGFLAHQAYLCSTSLMTFFVTFIFDFEERHEMSGIFGVIEWVWIKIILESYEEIVSEVISLLTDNYNGWYSGRGPSRYCIYKMPDSHLKFIPLNLSGKLCADMLSGYGNNYHHKTCCTEFPFWLYRGKWYLSWYSCWDHYYYGEASTAFMRYNEQLTRHGLSCHLGRGTSLYFAAFTANLCARSASNNLHPGIRIWNVWWWNRLFCFLYITRMLIIFKK